MSANLNGFGLRPVKHLGASQVVAHAIQDGIPSGYATSLYRGTPVAYDSNGHVVIAANGSDFVGAFAGVEYTDANGRRTFSDAWTANTVASEVVVYVYDDPNIVYEMQADGSVAQTAIGDQADISSTVGSTVSDGDTIVLVSHAALSATLKGAGVQGMFRIIDKSLDPSNDWGDAFTVVQVQVARHQFVASKVAI